MSHSVQFSCSSKSTAASSGTLSGGTEAAEKKVQSSNIGLAGIRTRAQEQQKDGYTVFLRFQLYAARTKTTYSPHLNESVRGAQSADILATEVSVSSVVLNSTLASSSANVSTSSEASAYVLVVNELPQDRGELLLYQCSPHPGTQNEREPQEADLSKTKVSNVLIEAKQSG
ncbi:SAG-related sequence SRS14A [Toxoplasma gondii]|uniref:SAG-related sequence SRS14A n=1 Tax=Toxoplasma gondii TaxID=5811 RepID=A0A7J6KAJ6_TOXGO|nr:SAG-related sequence SRS14A [Toxoplasma gondii]